MRRALMAFIGLLVATAATAATLAARRVPPAAQEEGEMATGPDSASVGRFLDAIGAAEPVVCEMISDQMGNFWWSGGNFGIGRVADTRAPQRAAKDSIGRRVSEPAAIRELSARLATDDPCVRQTAAKMLGNSAVSDEALGRLLDSPTARVREAALRATGGRDRPALRARVERMLGAREIEVVAMAAWALGESEQKSAIPALRRALEHESAQVRMNAAWAVGEREDRAALPLVEQLATRDADRRVRHVAVEALGELQQARSLGALVSVLEGSDRELAVLAAESIGQLENLQGVPPALVRALESDHPPLRLAALHALVDFEDEALAPAFLPYVTHADAEIRQMVIEALGEMRARIAIPAIKRALNDSSADVRRSAIEALAEIDDQ